MVAVKICGITNEEDETAAINAGAKLLGFVVDVPSSPRNLPSSIVKRLIGKMPNEVDSVAVTKFSDTESLRQLLADVRADYLQVHGTSGQSLVQLDDIRDHIIIAVNGEAKNASRMAVEASKSFRFVLLDSATELGLGGTGRIHDWHMSRRIRDEIYPSNLILAGGLTPQNVAEAIGIVNPFGVDVSTGVEKKPGFKDAKKMREFIARARGVKM